MHRQVIADFASPVATRGLLRYLETGGADSSIRPWVWIACFALGPLISNTVFEYYLYIATRMIVQTEAIVTQLVFEHALRIRLKSEPDSEIASKTPYGAGDRPATAGSSENAAGPPGRASSANLIGKINNLVTTDLNNITLARDFLSPCE